MEENHYKYTAFISYRHNDLDKYVAENLHRLIETYKMPKPVVEKYNITDNNVRRVFRDQEELPLSANLEDPITEALKQSKFLVVICSPRLKESIWCKKEIETFIKYHGRSNILCVLVEGEPAESFPEELMHYEKKEIDEYGKEIITEVSYEPLAMDVRGKNKREIYNKLKTELIRIIAPIYNLDYDDIKRRHEERKTKNKIRIFKIIALVCFIFAVYSGILFLKIYSTSNKLKHEQAISLAEDSKELLLKDDRKGAIEKAYQSLTEYKNIDMPETSEGLVQLTESVGTYYTPNQFFAVSQLNTRGVVKGMKVDKSRNYLLSYDESRELILWDLDTENKIKTITNRMICSYIDQTYTFISDKAFAYQNTNKEIIIVDLSGKEINKIALDFEAGKIISDEEGKYLVVCSSNMGSKSCIINVYETTTFSKINEYILPNDLWLDNDNTFYFDENVDNIFFVTKPQDSEIKNEFEVNIYSIADNTIIDQISINYDIKKIYLKQDTIIILCIDHNKTNFDSIIINYNYKDKNIEYEKRYHGLYPKDIYISNDSDTMLLLASGMTALLDFQTGNERTYFTDIGNVVLDYKNDSNNYIIITDTGNCFEIIVKSDEYNNDKSYYDVRSDIFNLNINCVEMLFKNGGLLTRAYNENRIIVYGALKKDDINYIEYDRKLNYDKVDYKEESIIIDEYNFDNKDIVNGIMYSDDKKYLFVSYKDNVLEIYDNSSKKLLNSIDGMGLVSNYLGKTENNEYIIIAGSGYILNEKFECIARIKNLVDYENGKLIIFDGYAEKFNYYEQKIYTKEEILDMAKENLNIKY